MKKMWWSYWIDCHLCRRYVNVRLVFSWCFGSSSDLVVPKVTTTRLCNWDKKSDFRIFTRRFTKSCDFSYVIYWKPGVVSSRLLHVGMVLWWQQYVEFSINGLQILCHKYRWNVHTFNLLSTFILTMKAISTEYFNWSKDGTFWMQTRSWRCCNSSTLVLYHLVFVRTTKLSKDV